MENNTVFGIPPLLVGFFCFILAGLFIYVWPKSKIKNLHSLSFPKFVLHYFHPLAWVLFGMAAFSQPGLPGLMVVLAGLGAVAFGMFIFIFLRS